MQKAVPFVVSRTGFKPWQVENTLAMLASGDTIPFIARYRKEKTGELDELAIETVRDIGAAWEALEKRRQAILTSMEEQGVLTAELRNRIAEVGEMSELEDIYLPFRPKRRTRASIARERGLEPLAKRIMSHQDEDPRSLAREYVNPSKDVPDMESALAGARDIVAEWISEDRVVRQRLRALFVRMANLSSNVVKGKEEEGANYRDYFSYTIQASRAPAHAIHAVLRAANEGFLRLRIAPAEEEALGILGKRFLKGRGQGANEVLEAMEDSWKRLLAPSLENEYRKELKEKADKAAVLVFTRNLRQLLMQAPLGRKRVLAIDPGFASGCKVVCLDEMGGLLHNETIYPHPPRKEADAAARKIRALVQSYKIEAIAIGNGTAGRETEHFIKRIPFQSDVTAVIVDESGASVYSASKVARDEFPDYDITVRGAISIGRRLMDPLAELVKVDPKSIGVGQYQHDVDQAMLSQGLGDTVQSCVNQVGVDLNTASRELLSYVAGLGPVLAGNIVKYRGQAGPFRNRAQLLDVPRLGPKAFEQSAGFLRVMGGDQVLDASAVHPESYDIIRRMAGNLGCEVSDLIANDTLVAGIDPASYTDERRGLPTVRDILSELRKPGRDPRAHFEFFAFDPNIRQISDLSPGMVLPGIVTNVTAFGAFVDIGIKENGLVHISQMADRFIRDPGEVVSLHQKLKVRVLEVDLLRKRIQLSLRETD